MVSSWDPVMKNYHNCAAACMSAVGIKRHTFGLEISLEETTVMYFDPSGCISACHPGIITLEMVVDLIHALGHPSSHVYGFEPHLVEPEQYPTSSTSLVLAGLTPTVPQDTAYTVKLTSEDISPPSVVRHAFSKSSSLFHCIQANSGTPPAERLMVKLTWRPVDSPSEAEILKAAQGIPGVPILHAFRDFERLSRGLRGRLHFIASPPHTANASDRILEAIVTEPSCVPLYSVTSLKTFLSAFLSLIKSRQLLGLQMLSALTLMLSQRIGTVSGEASSTEISP